MSVSDTGGLVLLVCLVCNWSGLLKKEWQQFQKTVCCGVFLSRHHELITTAGAQPELNTWPLKSWNGGIHLSKHVKESRASSHVIRPKCDFQATNVKKFTAWSSEKYA